jgi:hypothetical protein
MRKPDGMFKYAGPVSSDLVQVLGSALGDLVPIGSPFEWGECSGETKDWKVTLTFADGTELTMFTQKSDMLFSGGPWQTVIGGQAYMQYSKAFLRALIPVVEALDLPVGRSAGGCCGSASDLFEVAFPAPQ